MPNYEIDPNFIESQYLAGENQTEFQIVAAVTEVADAGISTEPNQNTNPVLIETIQRPSRLYDKYYNFDYGE